MSEPAYRRIEMGTLTGIPLSELMDSLSTVSVNVDNLDAILNLIKDIK